jgi:hypothetical protein
MRYGTIADPIEEPVFALQTGEVTQPLDSVYGYFLIRLEGERIDKSLPPLEEMRDEIRRSVQEQKMNLMTAEALDRIFEEYGYRLNEEAVRTLFKALPEDQELMPLPPKEEWRSLNLKPTDLDMELMRYGDEVWTLRRYYDYYEATPILGRPRQDRRVAGLRRDLRRMVVRDLMPVAAEDRGYMDRPEIVQDLKEKREQVMVSTLHSRLIAADVEVTNEMIADYWEENKHLYDKPEVRTGRVLISSDEAAVRAAYDEARSGADWTALVKKYGDLAVMPLGDEQGRFGPAREDRSDHVATALLWAQEGEGEICAPMELPGGLWGIGRVDELTPTQESTLVEVGEQVKRNLESQESERLFQERVGQWRSQMEIKVYPERLDDAVYAPRQAPAAATATGSAAQEGAQS